MRYEILNLLKKSDDYVSGEDIGTRLNISRTAVWKNISKLRAEGYNISSVSNRGYRLEQNIDIFNEAEIGCKNCICLDIADSTNEEAKRRAVSDFGDFMLIAAAKQFAGKGRLGRSWEDEGDKNAMFSLLLRPDIAPEDASQLTLVAGMAAANTLKKYLNAEIKIKWPNDILANGKKIVGILTEMSVSVEQINYVIVGVGINVNTESFSEEIMHKATSMYIIAGKKFSRAGIIRTFVDEFLPLYNDFCSKGFDIFCDRYNSCCINVGKRVHAVGRHGITDGKALGVDNKGSLVIECDNGEKKAVISGEVTLNDMYK